MNKPAFPVYFNPFTLVVRMCLISPACQLGSVNSTLSPTTDVQKLKQPQFHTPYEQPEANFHLWLLAASCGLFLSHYVALCAYEPCLCQLDIIF